MAALDPGAVTGQLTDWFVKLPLAQKILIPVIVAASVAGILFVSKWAQNPDYAVLYHDLDEQDAAAVVSKLKEMKIKYELRADGKTVAISPGSAVHETRLSLASDGVPKGGKVGFELFDSNNLGTTVLQEKIKVLRGLQGELERTISALASVAAARVHITQPEKTVFAKKAAEPTASVLLKLKPGGELDKKQIKGIANLVAGSVEGLTPANVNIVDVHGNLLTPKEEGEESMGAEATRLQYQREIERGFVQRVEQMLARVIGPDRVIARVTAEMDFTVNEREEESYDPGGRVLRSERTIEEGSAVTQRAGVPGVVSNIAEATNQSANASKDNSSRKEEVKNYELTRAVTKSSSPRGKLTRLSVAVLVDGTYEQVAGGDGKSSKTFVPLPDETISRIEGVVKSAVGFDGTRGDVVTVENVPFFTSDIDMSKELDAKASQDLMFRVLSEFGPFLFYFLVLFVVVRPLVKFLLTPTEAEIDLTRLLPTGITDLERELEAERGKTQLPAFEPAVDLAQLEELMAENSKIVKENPQQAALLIRYWLNDGRL